MVRQLPWEAEMLRKARIEMGYTQQQVATLIGVHIKAYPALHAHKEPSILWHRIKILSTASWT